MLSVDDVKRLKPGDKVFFSNKVWIIDGWNIEETGDHFVVKIHNEKDTKITSSFTNEQLHLVGDDLPGQSILTPERPAKKSRAKKRA